MPQPTPAKFRDWPWVLAILLAAIAVRAVHLIYLNMDSDHAVVGLMAMHMLDGEFTTMYWSSDYGGTQESWLAAAIFWFFGPSRPALGAATILSGMGCLLGLYLGGKELWGRRAGLAAMALAAMGPFYLVWHHTVPRAIYSVSLALACLLIWVAARMLHREPGSRSYLRHAGLFGVIAGQALWAHPITIGVLLPCALLLWRADPVLVIRPRFAMMMGGVTLGSLPWLIYNLTHNWQTLHFLLAPKPRLGLWADITAVVQGGLPVLLGLIPYKGQGWAVPGLRYAVLLGFMAAAAWALWVWGGQLIKRIFNSREGDGSELVLLAGAGVIGIFIMVGGAASQSFRYLLFLYAVIPLLGGWAYARLAGWSPRWRWAALGALLMVCAFNLAGSIASTPLFDEKWRQNHQTHQADTEQFVDFFVKHGLKYALTADYWLAKLVTFDAAKQVIVARSAKDRYPPYYYAAMRAPSTPQLAQRRRDVAATTSTLQAMGAKFETVSIGKFFKVFYPLRPPSLRPDGLSAAGWRARTKENPSSAALAWDRVAGTSWHAEGFQQAGQNFELDLGRVVDGVCQVLILAPKSAQHPAALTLSGSVDGKLWVDLGGWKKPVWPGVWSGGKMVIFPTAPWQELRFDPARLRYLRLTVARGHAKRLWAIAEIIVGAATKQGQAAPDPQAAARWLGQEIKQGPLWCEPILKAWIRPGLRVPGLAAFRPPWLADYLFPRMVLGPAKPLYLAVRDGLAPLALRALASCDWQSQHQIRHGFTLITATPPEPHAIRLLGEARTPTPTPNGWEVDLGSLQYLAGVSLSGGRESVDLGRLRLQVSSDGSTWRSVNLSVKHPPQLYWAGVLPLAAQGYPLRLMFPKVQARRLRLTGPSGWELPQGLKVTPLAAGP